MTFDANIASLLTDAHAHPTDDPTLRAGDEQGLQDLAQRLCEVPLGRVCAMSSCSGDQELVRNLALEVRRLQAEGSSKKSSMDLRPCFGYHPWYSHTISLDDEVTSREDHYRSLLIDSRSTLQAKEELEALLPHLPPPRSLKAILSELRTHLEEFPSALLGEVGLDRAFRIPAAKHVVQDQPSEQGLLDSQPPTNEHTLALRGKRLTTLSVPIEHQLKVVLAQIGVAVDLGRSVSFHSVRAPEATIQLLKESCRVYNGANGRAFRDICLDLHSCTLSEEMISAILRTHPNVFVSFSVTINLRQKSLASQLSVVPPTRLLIESDWHTAGDLAERNYEMLKMATPYVLREEPGACKDGGDVNEAAKSIAHNWERFDRSLAQRRGDVDMENDGDDDELEEASHETIRKFEANWWKQMKCLR